MKLYGVVRADEEATAFGVKALSGMSHFPVPIRKAIHDLADEVFQNKKYPFEIKEDHVRHFFSKLNLGVVPVQSYAGRTIESREELLKYFDLIAQKAHGPEVFAKHFYYTEKFDKDQMTLTDLTKDDVDYLRTKFSTDFMSLAFSTEDFVPGADVVIPAQKSVSATKRVLYVTLKVKTKEEK